ncbi:MAG: adenylyltransferase/cytidyltransferase family protein [Firmicutes bacterium]|nr:adenylyltransferase/cytidyltransferase family protein [Bacillota bacterium]
MKNDKKVVITYGTFDLFHKGHYNILKRAKDLGDYLIVGVTGENYDMERGKLSVRDSLAKRIENVSETGFADKIIVEEYLGQKIQDILQYHVDVLVVGSDWTGKFDHMRKYCEVVYLERTKDISSTQLRETAGDILSLGIVTDDILDDDMVLESKYVSGVHVEAAYSDNAELIAEFTEKFELDQGYTDYDAFLDKVDIVYVKCRKEKKYGLIKKALERDKIVMSSPITGRNEEEVTTLYQIAAEEKKMLIECVPTFYLQAFLQLLWNAKGNLIGDLLYIENEIRLGSLTGIRKEDLPAHLYFSILIAMKIIGADADFRLNRIEREGGDTFALLTGQNESGIYISKISDSKKASAGLTIRGTKGTIHVPDDWWNIGYFELHDAEQDTVKRYSCNFDGNGLRYVLVSVLDRVKMQHYTDLRLLKEESVGAIKEIERIMKDEK